MSRNVFRLRIAIVGTDPEVWRCLDVSDDLTLWELHNAIQLAFGWRESHLHQFTDASPYERRLAGAGRGPRYWMIPDDENEGDPLDETTWTIGEAVETTDGALYYEYDFGDGWVHRVEVMERAASGPGAPRVALIDGALRGPLEDSGGIGGYAELVRNLDRAPKTLDAWERERLAWAHGTAGPWDSFDPTAFPLEATAEEMQLAFVPASFPDMSGLITEASVAAGVAPDLDSLLVELLSGLPVWLRVETRIVIHRDGVLAPVRIHPDAAAGAIEPVTWLLRRAAEGGIPLSKAGWMPETVVRELMDELHWTDRWPGTSRREHLTPPVARLRATLTRLGILRKQNGMLVPTKDAARLAHDPIALWQELAARIMRRQRDDVTRLAIALLLIDIARDGRPDDLDHSIAVVRDVLRELGWSTGPNGELSLYAVHQVLEETRDVLEAVGAIRHRGMHLIRDSSTGPAFARAALRLSKTP